MVTMYLTRAQQHEVFEATPTHDIIRRFANEPVPRLKQFSVGNYKVKNCWIQTSQTGGQSYSDTSPYEMSEYSSERVINFHFRNAREN